jgi:hypothetical protein
MGATSPLATDKKQILFSSFTHCRVHIVVLLNVMVLHVAPTVNVRSHGLPTDPVDTPDALGGEIVPGAALPLALVKVNEAPFCATVSISPIPTDGQYSLQT